MPASERNARLLWLLKLAALALISAALFLAAMHFDKPVFELVNNRHGVEQWFYLAMRQLGELVTWVAIAVVAMLVDVLWSKRRSVLGAFERGLLIIWSPTLAGISASLLKLMIRRERPDAHGGAYFFRPWSEMTWDSSNLGLPSGHAAVAFGGAWILSMMYPRLAPLWLLGATLCGLSRLMTQAHFLSDVFAGGVLGFACAWVMWSMYNRWCADRDPVLLRMWHAMGHGRAGAGESLR